MPRPQTTPKSLGFNSLSLSRPRARVGVDLFQWVKRAIQGARACVSGWLWFFCLTGPQLTLACIYKLRAKSATELIYLR